MSNYIVKKRYLGIKNKYCSGWYYLKITEDAKVEWFCEGVGEATRFDKDSSQVLANTLNSASDQYTVIESDVVEPLYILKKEVNDYMTVYYQGTERDDNSNDDTLFWSANKRIANKYDKALGIKTAEALQVITSASIELEEVE